MLKNIIYTTYLLFHLIFFHKTIPMVSVVSVTLQFRTARGFLTTCYRMPVCTMVSA